MNTNNNSNNNRNSELRNWSAIAHGSAALGLIVPFGTIVGPLLVALLKKQDLPEAAIEARKALDYQIPFVVLNLLVMIAGFFLINTGVMALTLPLILIFHYGPIAYGVYCGFEVYNRDEYRYPPAADIANRNQVTDTKGEL